ncbi:hypothetical protein ACROYT_G004565 [Oculina patagonica]
MQPGERSPPLKSVGDNLTTCPCNACFQRKDLNNEAMLTQHREFYNQNRLIGFGPQMTMLPFAPIPSSPAGLYATHSLQRPSYPREMFASAAEGRFSLGHGVQDMPKRSALHEGHLVQSQVLQRSPDPPGRFWQQQPSRAGPHEKPRRMRTVFSPQQLERLERHFKSQQYVGSAQRIYIASQLGLSETQVKVWFQNRRIRWRKQVLGNTAAKPQEES